MPWQIFDEAPYEIQDCYELTAQMLTPSWHAAWCMTCHLAHDMLPDAWHVAWHAAWRMICCLMRSTSVWHRSQFTQLALCAFWQTQKMMWMYRDVRIHSEAWRTLLIKCDSNSKMIGLHMWHDTYWRWTVWTPRTGGEKCEVINHVVFDWAKVDVTTFTGNHGNMTGHRTGVACYEIEDWLFTRMRPVVQIFWASERSRNSP